MVYALGAATGADRERLEAVARRETREAALGDDHVDGLRQLIEDVGARSYAEGVVTLRTEEALAALGEAGLEPAAIEPLDEMARYLTGARS